MATSFNYFYTTQSMGELQIDNIGQCAIQANNDSGEFWYLVVKTRLGSSRVFSYGPLAKGVDFLHKSTKMSFKRIEYDEGKIEKEIKGFLNNPFADITQAMEISPEEALAECKSFIEYMKDDEAF